MGEESHLQGALLPPFARSPHDIYVGLQSKSPTLLKRVPVPLTHQRVNQADGSGRIETPHQNRDPSPPATGLEVPGGPDRNSTGAAWQPYFFG